MVLSRGACRGFALYFLSKHCSASWSAPCSAWPQWWRFCQLLPLSLGVLTFAKRLVSCNLNCLQEYFAMRCHMKLSLKLTSILALAVVSLTACQPSASKVVANTPPATEDAGPKPKDANSSIKGYLHSVLRDPDSLRDFSATEPRVGAYFVPVLQGGPKNVPAWYSCFSYNAKNGFGGYVGVQRYVAFFKDHQIIGVIDMENPWSKHQCR